MYELNALGLGGAPPARSAVPKQMYDLNALGLGGAPPARSAVPKQMYDLNALGLGGAPPARSAVPKQTYDLNALGVLMCQVMCLSNQPTIRSRRSMRRSGRPLRLRLWLSSGQQTISTSA